MRKLFIAIISILCVVCCGSWTSPQLSTTEQNIMSDNQFCYGVINVDIGIQIDEEKLLIRKEFIEQMQADIVRNVDIYLISNVMAGESYQSEWEDMKNVGMAILNRVDDPRFPDTLHGVVTQANQMNYKYGRKVARVYLDAATEVYDTWIQNKNGADLPWDGTILWWSAGGGTKNIFRSRY